MFKKLLVALMLVFGMAGAASANPYHGHSYGYRPNYGYNTPYRSYTPYYRPYYYTPYNRYTPYYPYVGPQYYYPSLFWSY